MGSNTVMGLIHTLSPIDHLSPRIHVPKLLYFGTTANQDNIISALRISLAKTFQQVPLLSGTIVLQDNPIQTGTLAIQAPFHDAEHCLAVKDMTDIYDISDIRSRNFPTDAVNVEDVLPDLTKNHDKVMLAQANFIQGGLILSCAIHHCVVDETGIFNFIALWAANCAGRDGSDIFHSDWIDRSALTLGQGPGRLEDHPEYKLRSEAESATFHNGPAPYFSEVDTSVESCVFYFPDEALARLKAAATAADCQDWISTQDALCALIWCRVTAARLNSGADFPLSMFNETVGGRKHLSMSPNYTGNVVFVSKALLPTSTLVTSPPPLASVALNVRKSVNLVDSNSIRGIIQMVKSVDDIGRLAPSGYSSHQRNLGCSSWARQDYYGLDWGLLGTIERVRWRKLRSDGLFIVFPRIPSSNQVGGAGGGLEIYLGMEREHLDYLMRDKMLGEYATWRCN